MVLCALYVRCEVPTIIAASFSFRAQMKSANYVFLLTAGLEHGILFPRHCQHVSPALSIAALPAHPSPLTFLQLLQSLSLS
jgi:hypothetical protein